MSASEPPDQAPSSGASGQAPEVLVDEVIALRPKRTWPKFVLMHLTILIAGIALLRHYKKPPHRPRVLVAVEVEGTYWAGSDAAETLAERFGEKAAALGLEIVHPRDKETLATLRGKDLAAAARAFDASFVLVGTTKVEAISYPLPNAVAPYWDVRGELDLVLRAEGAPDVACGHLSSLVGAPDRGLALRGVAEGLADQAIDESVGPILRSPAAARFSNLKTAKGETALAPAFAWLSARERADRDAAAAYARGLEARKAGEKGPRPITYLAASASAHDELLGVGADLVVGTADIHTTLTFDTKRPAFQRRLRALEVRPPTGPGRLLYRGAGVFAWPHEPAAPFVLVEDLFGYARALTVVEPTGLRRLRVDPEHRWDGPRVSPDARHVLAQDRACASCPAELAVFALATGKEVFRVRGDAFAGYTWLDAATFLFVHRSDAKAPRNPALVRDGAAVFPVTLGGEGGAVGAPFAVPDDAAWVAPVAAQGKVAFEQRSGDKGVAVLEWSSGTVVRRAAGLDARALAFAPDGRLAFELHDPKLPEEVGVIGLDGVVTVLTRNLAHDKGPRFSPDGRRLYFTTEADDPWFPGQRTVSWVAWVEPP